MRVTLVVRPVVHKDEGVSVVVFFGLAEELEEVGDAKSVDSIVMLAWEYTRVA